MNKRPMEFLLAGKTSHTTETLQYIRRLNDAQSPYHANDDGSETQHSPADEYVRRGEFESGKDHTQRYLLVGCFDQLVQIKRMVWVATLTIVVTCLLLIFGA